MRDNNKIYNKPQKTHNNCDNKNEIYVDKRIDMINADSLVKPLTLKEKCLSA